MMFSSAALRCAAAVLCLSISLPLSLLASTAAARDTGAGVEVEWNLSLCQEPNQCPGAPAPVTCPTATPHTVFTVRQTPGDVTLRQAATLWVCP